MAQWYICSNIEEIIDIFYPDITSNIKWQAYHFISYNNSSDMSSVSHKRSLNKRFIGKRSAVKPFVATHATQAYVIRGHGSEGDHTFTVPEDCVIVVKMQTGALSYVANELIPKLCSLTSSILKDPEKYYSDIHEAFGSVAIYLPGDTCSNFNFSLVECYPSESYNWCGTAGSGIINIDSFLDKSNNICSDTNIIEARELFREIKDGVKNKSSTIYKYIGNLFKNSVYPRSEDVLNYIDDLSDEDLDKDENGIVSLNKILSEIDEHFKVTQEKLCNTPGVYYNFVCRANDATSQLFNRQSNRHVLHNSITSVFDVKHKENKGINDLHKASEELSKVHEKLSKVQEKYFADKKSYAKMEKTYQMTLKKWAHKNPTLRAMDITRKQLRKQLEEREAQIESLRSSYDVQYKLKGNAEGVLHTTKKVANTLQNHIGEAEAHRKHHIKRMYNERYAANAARRAISANAARRASSIRRASAASGENADST